jgi:hypothetical protein
MSLWSALKVETANRSSAITQKYKFVYKKKTVEH